MKRLLWDQKSSIKSYCMPAVSHYRIPNSIVVMFFPLNIRGAFNHLIYFSAAHPSSTTRISTRGFRFLLNKCLIFLKYSQVPDVIITEEWHNLARLIFFKWAIYGWHIEDVIPPIQHCSPSCIGFPEQTARSDDITTRRHLWKRFNCSTIACGLRYCTLVNPPVFSRSLLPTSLQEGRG